MSISAVPDAGTAPNPASEEATARDHAEPAPRERPRPATRLHLGTATVLLIGLVITAGLALGAQSVHNTNEDRLLRQRVRETAAVVTAAIPNVQTPLASAAVLAEATGAQADPFERLMQTAGDDRWAVHLGIVVVGRRPAASGTDRRRRSTRARTAHASRGRALPSRHDRQEHPDDQQLARVT